MWLRYKSIQSRHSKHALLFHSPLSFEKQVSFFRISSGVTGNWGPEVFTWSCQRRQSSGVAISKHRIYMLQLFRPYAPAAAGEAVPPAFVNTINSLEPRNICAWNPDCHNGAKRNSKLPSYLYSKAPDSLRATEQASVRFLSRFPAIHSATRSRE